MLVGLVDPRHRERRADMPGRLPRWIPRDQLLAESVTWGPRESPWPYELLNAVLLETQDRTHFSTTLFTSPCKRGSVIERKADFIGWMDDMYSAIRGTLIHRTLEMAARPGSVAEVKFYSEVNDVEVSCTPDLLTDDSVFDWKTTKKLPTYDYPWGNHVKQLNYNRFLVNNATRWEKDGQPYELHINPWEWNFEHLIAVYLGPEGVKVLEATESQQVPNVGDPTKTHAKRVPSVWPDEVVYTKLSTDLEAMQAALRSFPDWPAGLEEYEGWDGPPSFKCPGIPLCHLPNCLAKRWDPDPARSLLVWESP